MTADADGERLDDAYMHACEELTARDPRRLEGAAVDRAAALTHKRDAQIHPATDAGMQVALHRSGVRIERFQSTHRRADCQSSRGIPAAAEDYNGHLSRRWSRTTSRSTGWVVEIGNEPESWPAHSLA